MRQTFNPGPQDVIGVYDELGYADGIQVSNRDGDFVFYVLTPERLAEMRAALDLVEQGQAKRARDFGRMWDEDGVYDRQRADADLEDAYADGGETAGF